VTAPPVSPVERMEQVLFDLLHLLSAADTAALALVEHALDPAGTPMQFFAASNVRHNMQQARAAVVNAQQELAKAFAGAPTVALETTGVLAT
jgi:hypothetical protein